MYRRILFVRNSEEKSVTVERAGRLEFLSNKESLVSLQETLRSIALSVEVIPNSCRHSFYRCNTIQFLEWRKRFDSQSAMLESEKEKYTTLLAEKNATEKQHDQVLKKTEKELQDSIDRATSLERSLEIVMTDDKERQVAHRLELEQRRVDTEEVEEKLKDMSTKNEFLVEELKQREEEVRQYAKQEQTLREEVTALKERIRDMEKKAGSFWLWFQANVLESTILSFLSKVCSSVTSWVFEDAVPAIMSSFAGS